MTGIPADSLGTTRAHQPEPLVLVRRPEAQRLEQRRDPGSRPPLTLPWYLEAAPLRVPLSAGPRARDRYRPARPSGTGGSIRIAASSTYPAKGGFMESVLLDVAGHRRSSATMPGYHRGRPPRNKGLCRRRHEPAAPFVTGRVRPRSTHTLVERTRVPWDRVVRWCCHGCGRLRSRGLFVSGRGS